MRPIERRELKQTLTVAVPIMLSQMSYVLQGIVDSIMVGNIGAEPLAAAAFVSNVMSVALVIAMGLSTAISVRVAQAYGEGKKRECGHILIHGFLYLAVIMISMSLFGLLFRGELTIFEQPDEIMGLSINYFIYTSLSLIPIAFTMSFRQFCEGLSDPVPPMVIQYLGVSLNIFLNWVLIFGNLGYPAMGLEGAGVATLVARVFIAITMVSYVLRSPKYKEFLPKLDSLKFQWVRIKRISHLGLPSAFQYLFEVCTFSFAGIMQGWISTEALAAHQIGINIVSLTFMIALGMSFATSIRIGHKFGARDQLGLQTVAYSSLKFIVGLAVFLGVLFWAFRNTLPLLYVDNAVVIEMAAGMLVIAAFFQVFDTSQALGIGALRGISDVKAPTAMTFVAYWVIGIPTSYSLTFVFDWGPIGIWYGLAVGLLVSSVLLWSRFYLLMRRDIFKNDKVGSA